jgi:serine-type D-Ala-D-Ala carboxypeptidase (penicillin-binding protein 5/6)
MQKRRFSLFFLIITLVIALFLPVSGMGAEQRSAVKKKKSVPSAEKRVGAEPAIKKNASSEPSAGEINARSAVLMEVSTGTILFEQNADEVIEPASFTKIMSLYLIFDALKQGRVQMNDEVYVSETAWRTGGSKMFVGVGSRVPLEELLKGISVVSGNDACVAAAEHLYGSLDAFVEAMNQKAAELGMHQSRFINPHGLPAQGQVTTAKDMALLDLAYLQRFPDSLRFHSMQEYTYNNISQHNRNRLLFKDPSVDGLKTGFVGAAGYHLSATSKREGMRLLAVVMGATTPAIREREALKLLNYGFRTYALIQPFPQDQPIATVKVMKGEKDELGLYPQENPSILIPQAQKNQIRWEVRAPAEATAPINPQQSIGEVVFYVGNEPRKNVTLISTDGVAQAGLFKRAWQSMLQIHKVDWRWFAWISGGVAVLFLIFLAVTSRRSSSRRSRSFGR